MNNPRRNNNVLFAIIGPTAVGKTFYTERLLKRFPGRLRRVKNTTTRAPRDEKDGKSYNFISKNEFEKKIKEGGFLEYDSYLGEYYGSSLESIRSVLKDASGIFALTPKGAMAINEHGQGINLSIILLIPESEETLRLNFRRRGIEERSAQDVFIDKAKEFRLPKEVMHTQIIITGRSDADEQKLLEIVMRDLPRD